MSVPLAGHTSHEDGVDHSSALDLESRKTDKASPHPENPQINRNLDSQDSSPEIIDWDGESDPECPFNWSPARKWATLATALLGTIIVAVNGTSITAAAEEINATFNVSDASFPNSYWPVTSWGLGGAVFIIIGLPLLEDLGVKMGYIGFYIFFFFMIIPQALAPNFATLIVTRFFSGGCVALLANTLASMIPDMWIDDRGRTIPITFFILAYLIGSTLGPPGFAGVMQHIGNWRWIFYIQLIIYAAYFPLFFFVVKETRGDVILRARARKLRKETGRNIYSQSELKNESILRGVAKAAYRPLYLVVTEPVLAASTVWSAFCFGTVYLFTQSVTQVFQGVYGWSEWSTCYVQGAVIVGEILGWFGTLLSYHLYLRSATHNTETPGRPIPEARLYVSIFASLFGLAGGMFVYAWTSYPSIPWIAPAIGLAMVGVGVMIVVTAVADYIEDAYAVSGYAGSAISAVASGENVMAAILPLATQSMYRSLGLQWASSLLGFIGLLLTLAPVVFVWKGRVLREKSPFMMAAGQGAHGGFSGCTTQERGPKQEETV